MSDFLQYEPWVSEIERNRKIAEIPDLKQRIIELENIVETLTNEIEDIKNSLSALNTNNNNN